MVLLWMNWKLPGKLCRMILGYSRLMGFVQRRQGRWEESTRSLERAFELDPRNINTLHQIALSYGAFRRYAEQKSAFDRALDVEPNDVETKVLRAFVELDSKADTRPLHQMIDEIRATNPAAMPKDRTDAWLICALAERDVAAAKDALTVADEIPLGSDAVHFTRPFVEGVIARMTNDEHAGAIGFYCCTRGAGENRPGSSQISARHGACSV